jgi:hypothetical protein
MIAVHWIYQPSILDQIELALQFAVSLLLSPLTIQRLHEGFEKLSFDSIVSSHFGSPVAAPRARDSWMVIPAQYLTKE